jgi:hypothetical protein
MSATRKDPVLIVGGSGFVGSQAARALRRLEQDLPIAIGGRNLERAGAVAKEIGNASAVKVDLDRPDLGLPGGQSFSAVAMFVKDDSLTSMKYALASGLPYLGISSGLFEIAPEVALYVRRPASAPILMASHWLAGMATLPVLYFARELRSITSIAIGAVLDEEDMGGPAAYADFERMTSSSPNGLILENGKWRWVGGEGAARSFVTVDGAAVRGQAFAVLDVVSLAAATDARSVRFDVAVGKTASRRRGEPFSTEIVIEIEGEREGGTIGRVRHEIVHPQGQAPMTALGVALAIQRLLGLAGGPPVGPGLYSPDVLLEPETVVQQLQKIGTQIRRVEPAKEG